MICEDCKFCKALTKIEGEPSFIICDKKQFAQNYPNIPTCSDYEKELYEIPTMEFTL